MVECTMSSSLHHRRSSSRPATIAIKALGPFRRNSSKKSHHVPSPKAKPQLPELRIQLSEDNDTYSSCYSTTPDSPLLIAPPSPPPPPPPPQPCNTGLLATDNGAGAGGGGGGPERRRADSCVVPLPSECSNLQLPSTESPMVASYSQQFVHEALDVSLIPNRTLHKSYSEILRASIKSQKVHDEVVEEGRRPRSRSYCAGIDTRRASQCSSMQQGSSKTLLTVPSLNDLLTDQRLLRQGVSDN